MREKKESLLSIVIIALHKSQPYYNLLRTVNLEGFPPMKSIVSKMNLCSSYLSVIIQNSIQISRYFRISTEVGEGVAETIKSTLIA